MASEKATAAIEKEKHDGVDLERLGEEHGYTLDARALGDAAIGLKTAKDGHTILIPQPADHPKDPLTWSLPKKHVTLFTITMISFLADFGSAIGIPAVIPQAMYDSFSSSSRETVKTGNWIRLLTWSRCFRMSSVF